MYVVLVQLSEVLDSKAWAMTMMPKRGRYPSDGDTKLNLITKKLTIKGAMWIDVCGINLFSLICWGESNQFRQRSEGMDTVIGHIYLCLFYIMVLDMIATCLICIAVILYISSCTRKWLHHCVRARVYVFKYGHSYVQLLVSRQHVKFWTCTLARPN